MARAARADQRRDPHDPGFLIVEGNASGGDQPNRLRQQLVLNGVNRLLQLVAVTRRGHRDSALQQHRSGVDALVDEVDGDPSDPDSVIERLADRIEPGERWKQRGVDVDEPAGEPLNECRREQLHVAGENDQLDHLRLEPVAHGPIARLTIGVLC